MRSISLYHYPQITFKNEEKYLWNPILKKAFKNFPEERVRLKFVEYLTEEVAFSKHRISFESPISLPGNKSSSRTDLICYDKEFKPLLLVECKAPDVTLNAKVALQIARYNQQVNAPFLLVTNGNHDYWFKQQEGTLSCLNEVPSLFQCSKPLERDFKYWSKRSFAGANAHPQTRTWLLESCSELYISDNFVSKFFLFEGTAPELFLANYYHIYSIQENIKLALALSSTPFKSTKLNAVLNKDGENIALLSISLDLLFSKEPKNSILQSQKGTLHLDIKHEIGFDLNKPLNSCLRAISDLMG